MPDDAEQLVAQLEKLRRALLAIETYMAQVRDLIAVTQAMIGKSQSRTPSLKPRKQADRSTSSKQ